jgi:hypothetical protein
MKNNFVPVTSSKNDARNFISEFSVLALVALAWKYVWISATFNLAKLRIHRSTQSVLHGCKIGGGDRWMGDSA